MQRFSRLPHRELLVAWAIVVSALLLASFCAVYAVRHFSVATDVKQLFPRDLAWTKRDNQFAAAFPQYQIQAVVEAPTQESAEQASAKLASALETGPRFIRAVDDPQD